MRIGIDTGGTFTDVVIHRDGAVTTFKVPSTPSDPSLAILSALADPRATADSGEGTARGEIVHGSTVATNALLEGKTAPVALLATSGFEDLLEIGRQDRASLYDIEVQRPRPLVPAGLRFGIPERVLADGSVRTPLDLAAVRRAGKEVRRLGAESIVVCFLHSYLRPEHEEEAGRILAETFHGPITLSSSIVREFREYERCSTATVNAAVSPVMGAYLGRLEEALPGGRLRVMSSNGGSAAPARAASEAVTTVLSGPAAGVVASAAVGAAIGRTNLITLDMGGTSTDVSLIPGEILLSGSTEIAGYPLRTPAIDIHTVGAGGGSVAWADPGGALKVGPASAGADPGPACYGRGGPPTVTDANLFLGRLPAEGFLGGRMKLDGEAAASAMAGIAGSLGISPEEAAQGILDVANVTMARAIRHVSLFRGHDPAGFALCAYGGAGGLHAAHLASSAGTGMVLIPPAPGVFSAWGLLVGDVMMVRTATVLEPSGELSVEGLEGRFAPLEEGCRRVMVSEMGAAGAVEMERSIEARYPGQSHELSVPATDWINAFHEVHRARFGFSQPEEEVIAVTLKVVARHRVAQPPPPPTRDEKLGGDGEEIRTCEAGRWRPAQLRRRAALDTGERIAGPAVITEAGSTIWVPSAWAARVIEGGTLLLEEGP